MAAQNAALRVAKLQTDHDDIQLPFREHGNSAADAMPSPHRTFVDAAAYPLNPRGLSAVNHASGNAGFDPFVAPTFGL